MNEPDPMNSCVGKVRYKNYLTAKASRREVVIKFDDFSLEVYECKHCRGFHLGHPPGVHIRKEVYHGKKKGSPVLRERSDSEKEHDRFLEKLALQNEIKVALIDAPIADE